MQRSMWVRCALLAVAISGCDQVKGVMEKATDKAKGVVTRFRGQDTTVATAPRDTARVPRQTPVQLPPPPPAPRYPTANTPPLQDQPYESTDTGTIAPGMEEREVYAMWGAPVGVRRAGEWTYLYFRNGCEYSCGTYDVVFLQNGLVVDAVLRWPGHSYSGQSSSPPGVVPLPTRGGDTLAIPPLDS